MNVEKIRTELKIDKIGVYYDLENEGISKSEKGLEKLQELDKVVHSLGQVVTKRVYAEFRTQAAKTSLELHTLGFDTIEVPHGIKNDVDFELSFDILESICQSVVDTYILITSDTDFLSVARRIKKHNKNLIVITWDSKIHDRFDTICDHVLYLGGDTVPNGYIGFEDVKSMVVEILKNSKSNGNEMHISALSTNLRNMDSRYGGVKTIYKNGETPFKKFKKFLEDPDMRDVVELVKKSNSYTVRLVK